jgi:chaperone required for assembly of F1-ATPase
MSNDMRNLFEDIASHDPLDPMEAARRGARPRLRRRFYERVQVHAYEGQFRIALDGVPAMTPARHLLFAPAQAVADLLAAEWAAQREVIDPVTMPLTRLANTIIDGVYNSIPEVAIEVENYAASDLVFYRAEVPPELARRQAAAWDPVLAWAVNSLGARFNIGCGLTHIEQPQAARRAVQAIIPREPWKLGALHAATTLTGSALIALACKHGALSLADAWSAAHVDEDWNIELWGRDELALARRAARFAEMQAAVAVLQAA